MASLCGANAAWLVGCGLILSLAGCDDGGFGTGGGGGSSSTGEETMGTAPVTSVSPTTAPGADTTAGGTSAGGGGTTVVAEGTSSGGTTSPGGTTEAGTSSGGVTSSGGTSSGGSSSSSSEGGPGGPVCGNGVIDLGEQCDGADLQGFDCAGLGLGGGMLLCDPVTCTFDTANCMPVGGCGNGAIDPGEQCDGLNLQGFTCASLGLGGGILACDPVMCTFDTSMCMPGGGTTG
ncbi:MAG: hypothetical protein AAGF11_40720 [Myxococcota bacterium]